MSHTFPLTPSGVILVDKPQGKTSHDVIYALRKMTGIKRIGHAGTLDPMATGLLVVLIGTATRLSDILSSRDKQYEATITFGSTTDTDDAEGNTLEQRPVPQELFDADFAQSFLAGLVGKQDQLPPKFSALKVEGKRAYDLARKGASFALKLREIEVLSAELCDTNEHNKTWTIRVHVSKGTYIRAIARDIGESLGCGAHLSGLRRIATHHDVFRIENAHTLEELKELCDEQAGISQAFVPLNALGLSQEPSLYCRDEDVLCGRYQFLVDAEDALPADRPDIALWSFDERLLSLGSYKTEDGARKLRDGAFLYRIRPSLVFPGGILGPNIGDSVVTLGVFDGVHRGHQALLQATVRKARELNLPSVACTFDPSPKQHFGKQSVQDQLCSLEKRIAYIKKQGIDYVFILPFTDEFSRLSGEEFLETLARSRCVPRALILGKDFHFGHRGLSTAETIAPYAHEHNISVETFELIEEQQQRISSTSVRAALLAGDIAHACELLGHEYAIDGFVVRGEGIGHTLGAPTANITPSQEIVVGEGVYAAHVAIGSDSYNAALFIGTPRDESQKRTVEVSLYDFEGDLYGATVRVTPLKKVDDVSRYNSFEELKTGVTLKMQKARKYFTEFDINT